VAALLLKASQFDKTSDDHKMAVNFVAWRQRKSEQEKKEADTRRQNEEARQRAEQEEAARQKAADEARKIETQRQNEASAAREAEERRRQSEAADEARAKAEKEAAQKEAAEKESQARIEKDRAELIKQIRNCTYNKTLDQMEIVLTWVKAHPEDLPEDSQVWQAQKQLNDRYEAHYQKRQELYRELGSLTTKQKTKGYPLVIIDKFLREYDDEDIKDLRKSMVDLIR